MGIRKSFLIAVFACLAAQMLFAQDASDAKQVVVAEKTEQEVQAEDLDGKAKEEPKPRFGLSLEIGAITLDDPFLPLQKSSYQTVGLRPEFSIGKFGIGLDLTIRYRFTGGPNKDQFEVYERDWVPRDVQDFFTIYLAKISYVRWAQKGEPLYIKLGSIEDGTLGNGFIMGNYANTLFLPERRSFGMSFDLDGALFSFPWVGFESFIGNFAAFDVIGGRFFVRPLTWLDTPVINQLQIGATLAADTDPYYPGYAAVQGIDPAARPVVFGTDFRLPVLNNDIIALVTFGDLVFQGSHTGGMTGVSGKLVNIFTFGGQIRILGENFVPSYFDATYDLYRIEKLALYVSTTPVTNFFIGWLGAVGISVAEDMFAFSISVDGPFGTPDPQNLDNYLNHPHMRIVLSLKEGLLPGFFVDASYDKKNIRSFGDLISAENAVIGAALNFKTGPAVVSVLFNVKYNPLALPGADTWQVTAGLGTSIRFF